MTFISNTAECRRLARNVVTADFDDTQIESYQTKEYSYIATLTDKDDWDSLDREFGALQLVETRLVAADIILHYAEDEMAIRASNAMREGATIELDKIINNMDTDTADTEFMIDRTDYKGWGLNSAIEPPNRLSGTADDTEGF